MSSKLPRTAAAISLAQRCEMSEKLPSTVTIHLRIIPLNLRITYVYTLTHIELTLNYLHRVQQNQPYLVYT